MILSCRYPGWPSEEKHHPTGSATGDGGSARAALFPTAGWTDAMKCQSHQFLHITVTILGVWSLCPQGIFKFQ